MQSRAAASFAKLEEIKNTQSMAKLNKLMGNKSAYDKLNQSVDSNAQSDGSLYAQG